MDADPWAVWRAFGVWPEPGMGTAPRAAGPLAGLAPQDFAERFTQAARTFLGAADAAPAGADAAATADAVRRFADTLRDLFATWQPAAQFGAPAGGGAPVPGAAPTPPAFGLTREHQLRWQRLGEASRQVEDAQRRLQRLWLDMLREAGAAYGTALARSPPAAAAGATAAAIRRLYDTWIDCAEDAHSRMAHGAAYCDALADAVNAGSRWRRELKALVEESAKLLDLPTRSELNTLQERLRAVEAELGAARRPVPGEAARRAPQTEPPPAAARQRRRRGPGKA